MLFPGAIIQEMILPDDFWPDTRSVGRARLVATEERDKLPDVVHQSEWESLKRDGKFILKPGSKMN